MPKIYSIKENHNIRTSMVRNDKAVTTKIEIDIDVTIQEETIKASVVLVQARKKKINGTYR